MCGCVSLPLLPHAQPRPGLRSPRMGMHLHARLQGPTALPGKGLSCCSMGNSQVQPVPQPVPPIPGLPEKSGCGFSACLQLGWIWVPMEVLAPHDCSVCGPRPQVCWPKPPCQNNPLLQWGRFRGLPAPCPSPGVCATSPHLYPSPEDAAGGALATVCWGCWDEARAAATPCPLTVLAGRSEGPCDQPTPG